MIAFNRPYVSGNELKHIQTAIESGALAGNGPFTKKIHEFLEKRHSAGQVLFTHSCTGALEMVALLFDLKPGDEVIVPSYTFSSTATAFQRTGAKIVFGDVDPKTMNMDPKDVAKRITPRTRAIIPIHYGGISADMKGFDELASGKEIFVSEDAAQGFDAKYRGKFLGTLSGLSTLSFHETKNIHCGLGGALYINDPKFSERAQYIWERGTNRAQKLRGLVDKYSWVDVGGSFYPSELQAAFLWGQFEALDQSAAIRKKIYGAYEKGLKPLESKERFRLPEIAPECEINHHSFFIIGESFETTESLRKHLVSREIQAFIGYVPLHSSKMGQSIGYQPSDLPLTEEFAYRVLRLPFHTSLSDQDVERVIEEISAFVS